LSHTLTYSLLLIFLTGLLPIAEVRGAIPLAFVLLGGNADHLLLGVITGIAGNLLIAPVVIPLLSRIESYILNSRRSPKFLQRAYRWVLSITRRRAESIREKSYVALTLFVAVPLPVTGAWTGSLIAYLLGMDKKKSIAAVEAGVLIASAIVFTATYLGVEALKKIFMLS